MSELLAKAKALTEGFHPGHSRFQIEHFIIGKQGTLYAQWRQCLAEINNRLEPAKQNDASALRELAIFIELADTIKDRLGELTPDREAELEDENWYWRARRKLAIDMLVHKQPTEGTVEFVLALPEQSRRPLLSIIERAGEVEAKALRTWLYNGAPALEA